MRFLPPVLLIVGIIALALFPNHEPKGKAASSRITQYTPQVEPVAPVPQAEPALPIVEPPIIEPPIVSAVCDCETTGNRCDCPFDVCQCQHCYGKQKASGKPLTVLVTAEWCTACPEAKSMLDASGREYAIVPADSELGQNINGNRSIPAVYYWKDVTLPGRRFHGLPPIRRWLQPVQNFQSAEVQSVQTTTTVTSQSAPAIVRGRLWTFPLLRAIFRKRRMAWVPMQMGTVAQAQSQSVPHAVNQ